MGTDTVQLRETEPASRKPWNTPRVIVSNAELTHKITNPREYMSPSGSLFGVS